MGGGISFFCNLYLICRGFTQLPSSAYHTSRADHILNVIVTSFVLLYYSSARHQHDCLSVISIMLNCTFHHSHPDLACLVACEIHLLKAATPYACRNWLPWFALIKLAFLLRCRIFMREWVPPSVRLSSIEFFCSGNENKNASGLSKTLLFRLIHWFRPTNPST